MNACRILHSSRATDRELRFGSAVAAAAALALTLTVVAPAGGQSRATSRWQKDLDKVDAKLRAGRWQAGQRAARKLAENVLSRGWHDRALRSVLADLACYQAAASANLDSNDEAAWYWHMAQNLDARVRDKDLAPYGEAAKLLREFPLRRRGQATARFRVIEPRYGRFTHAVMAEGWSPAMPSNPGARDQRPEAIHVELIVDRHGRPHHPVVLARPHPVMVYGLLDALRQRQPS